MKKLKFEDLTLDNFKKEVDRLNNLGATIKSTYFKEYDIIIFKYMYYSHEDGIWDDPYMQECRGISFNNTSGALVSRPFPKFFNINEVETTKLDNLKKLDNQVVQILNKHDGSLIIVENHNDEIVCRTQKTYYNEQSELANKVYKNLDDITKRFTNIVLASNGTPLFELVGPSNKVVVSYETNKLIYIGYRDNLSGVVYFNEVSGVMSDTFDYDEYFDRLEDETNIEGVVLHFPDSNILCKRKIGWYLKRHRAKDFLNRPKAFLEMFIDKELDDVLALLEEPFDITLFKKFEEMCIIEYNNMICSVEQSYEQYKHLDRKSYAITLNNKPTFHLLMDIYLKREIKWKRYWMNVIALYLTIKFEEFLCELNE